jgi:hypothetical protein
MTPFRSDFVFDEAVHADNFGGMFFFASSHLMSLGAEYGFANSRWTHWIVMFTHFCGVLMNLVLFGVLLSKFTSRKSNLMLSSPVLSKVAGKPCLTFRVGHKRGQYMLHPEIRISLIVKKRARDGGSAERYGGHLPLKLAGGNRYGRLPPSIYLRHFIDEHSPLFDATSASGTIFEQAFEAPPVWANVSPQADGSTGDAIDQPSKPQPLKLNLTRKMLGDAGFGHLDPSTFGTSSFAPLLFRVVVISQEPTEVGFAGKQGAYLLNEVRVNHKFADCLKRGKDVWHFQDKNGDDSNTWVDFNIFYQTIPLDPLDAKDVASILDFGEAGEAGRDFERPILSATKKTSVAAGEAGAETEAKGKRPLISKNAQLSALTRRASAGFRNSFSATHGILGRRSGVPEITPTGKYQLDGRSDLLVSRNAGPSGLRKKRKRSGWWMVDSSVLGPMLFDTFHWARSLSWPKLTVFIAGVYVSIALVFAAMIVPLHAQFVFDASYLPPRGKFEQMFYFASAHLISFGVEYGYANGSGSQMAVMMMHYCGSILHLLLFGVLLAKFTMIKSALILARKVVLSTLEKTPCLTFRVGHFRGQGILHPKFTALLVCATHRSTTPPPADVEQVAEEPLEEPLFFTSIPFALSNMDEMPMTPPSFYFRHYVDEKSIFYDPYSKSGTIFDRTLAGDKSVRLRLTDDMRRAAGLPDSFVTYDGDSSDGDSASADGSPSAGAGADSNLTLEPRFISVAASAFDEGAMSFVTCSNTFRISSLNDMAVNHKFADAIVGPYNLELSKFFATEPLPNDSPHAIAIQLPLNIVDADSYETDGELSDSAESPSCIDATSETQMNPAVVRRPSRVTI